MALVKSDRYIVGLDLGQSIDPTALCVLHCRYDRGPPPQSSIMGTALEIRHLERLKLGTSYPDIVTHVEWTLDREPLRDGCELVIDSTGVGRAVANLFDAAGMRPIKVSITAGAEQTSHGNRCWNVAKGILISTLDAALHTGELKFAAALTTAPALAEELKDFRRKVSDAGRSSYGARVGKHDDLVLAVALALWRAKGGGPGQVHVGHVTGLCS